MSNSMLDIIISACADAQLQDDNDTMSYPYYALTAKKKVTETKTYYGTDADGTPFMIELFPNAEYGMHTIHDYDIVMYVISHVAQAIKEGNTPSKTVRVTMNHLLSSIGRSSGGDHYKDLKAALARIQGTLIRSTKLKVVKGRKHSYQQFTLLEKVRFIQETGEYEMGLCDWIFDSILEQQVLAISPDYFQIRSGLERRLYLMFRKHAGNQRYGYWIPFDNLYKKSGSEDLERKFRSRVKNFIEKKNNLPEYCLSLETNHDGIQGVRGIRQDFLDMDDPRRITSIKKRPKMLANSKTKKALNSCG